MDGVVVDKQEVCLQNASMPNILVRDLPPEVHEVLRTRAERAGLSLQQYLVAELQRLAGTPTLEEVFDRVGRRSGGSIDRAEMLAELAERRGR